MYTDYARKWFIIAFHRVSNVHLEVISMLLLLLLTRMVPFRGFRRRLQTVEQKCLGIINESVSVQRNRLKLLYLGIRIARIIFNSLLILRESASLRSTSRLDSFSLGKLCESIGDILTKIRREMQKMSSLKFRWNSFCRTITIATARGRRPRVSTGLLALHKHKQWTVMIPLLESDVKIITIKRELPYYATRLGLKCGRDDKPFIDRTNTKERFC